MKTENPIETAGPSEAELALVAAELRALGEPELEPQLESHAIAALLRESAVLTAFALAHPSTSTTGPIGVTEAAPLAELDRHRVWRRVVARRGGGARPSVPTWRATWVAVATAAGLALVPMLSPRGAGHEATPASRAAAEALGLEARSALDGVPGEQDGARASALATQYAARLGGPTGAPEVGR